MYELVCDGDDWVVIVIYGECMCVVVGGVGWCNWGVVGVKYYYFG